MSIYSYVGKIAGVYTPTIDSGYVLVIEFQVVVFPPSPFLLLSFLMVKYILLLRYEMIKEYLCLCRGDVE